MLKQIFISLFLLLAALDAGAASPKSGMVTVQITPQPANTFIARQALGAGVDGLEKGDVAKVYTPANLKAMRSAGLGALTYRLRTELGVEAWHWNPQGRWSKGGRAQGYWTSNPQSGKAIPVCYGYRLPRRGSTVDQANNDGYSRLDDGDSRTFWKSNPYLDQHFTGEDNAKHPQWVLINFGRKRPINAIQIAWGVPFATHYQVQYWSGNSRSKDEESLVDTFGPGQWRPFPFGADLRGQGGQRLLRLASAPVSTRFVRLWMTESGGRAQASAADVRDRVGYAIREIGAGTLDARGRFHDLVRHAPSGKRQTQIVVSSTDPWHRAADEDFGVEQPGFDRVFHSGLTDGQPVLVPAGILYDTPENAVAELQFLRARGYPVTHMELGEEPDGQYVTPEDYGALYVQWADALHRVDPALHLGGPSLQTTLYGTWAWPDAQGNRSWMNRFLRYLQGRGHLADYTFFSFEWYPFDNVCGPSAPKLAIAPTLLANVVARLQRDGLSRQIPWLITEYGYSAFAGQAEMEMPGAMLDAETAAQFLLLGGSRTYFYGYEPNEAIQEATDCLTWGNLALWLSRDDHRARWPLATYYGARLLTRQWAQPGTSGTHRLYKAVSDIRNRDGMPLVTAYAVRRPDGQWAVLLLNKDPMQAHRVTVKFQPASDTPAFFAGPVDLYQYSSAQYVWHPNKDQGYPAPDLPPAHQTTSARTLLLPPFSLSVVRGRVPE